MARTKDAPAPTIAAIMIVKNEAHVVSNAIRSVRGFADHWVIMDTGSSDGTVELLHDLANDPALPGIVHSGPFIDFSQARNLLIDHAEPTADWMVILDADMAWIDADVLRGEIMRAQEGSPEIDGFLVKIVGDAETYWQVRVFRSGRGWRYKYRTHELAHKPGRVRLRETRSTAEHFATGGSRANKQERDLRLLTLDLKDNPNDPVSHYYLAGTLRDLGRYEEAIVHFRKAISLDPVPDSEANYIALLNIAQMYEEMPGKQSEFLEAALESATLRPQRFEARYILFKELGRTRRFQALLDIEDLLNEAAPTAAPTPNTKDRMYVREEDEPASLIEVARAAHALGNTARFTAARDAARDHPGLTESQRRLIHSWPT